VSDTRAPELDQADVPTMVAEPAAEAEVEADVEAEAAPSRAPRSRRSSRSDNADRAGSGSAAEDDAADAAAAVDAEGSTDATDADGADGAAAGGSSAGSRRGKVSLRRLEEEGEVAADYLEELLDIVDLDGDIDIDVENGRASVAIVAEPSVERDLRRLVGGNGEVLEALQELARLAVQARTGERSRLMLDVVGYRAGRRRALATAASRACEEVVRTGAPVRMDPMSAFERKVVHDVVADAGLVSESEGEEPGRRVVIHPAGA
jgi:spoIIIJ-associated protein